MQQQRQGMGGVFAPAARAAGIEARRLNIGEQVSGAVMRMTEVEQKFIGRFLPASMRMIDGLTDLADSLLTAYEEGGVMRMGTVLAAWAGSTASAAANALENALDPDTEVEMGTRMQNAAEQLRRGETVSITGDPTIDRAITGLLQAAIPGADAVLPAALRAAGETMEDHGRARQETYTRERGLQPPPSTPGPQSSARDAVLRAREGARLLHEATFGLEEALVPRDGSMESAPS